MIMPANYSAIAENELEYIDGGYVEPMTSVKILEKNIVEWIGARYAGQVINAFIGNWFTNDGDGNVFNNVFSAIGGLFTGESGTIKVDNQGTTAGKVFAGIRNTIGVLGAIYVLGTDDDLVDPDGAADTWKSGLVTAIGDF